MASTLVFANNAGSTLAGSISNTAVSLNLQAGGGALFPNPTTGQYFVITAIDAATGLLREIMWCTSRSTDTLTVVRAQEGTTALAWNAGDLIQELWTAGQASQMLQLGQAGKVYVPIVPATVWYVDGTLGTDAPGQGLTSGLGAFRTITYAVNTISQYFSSSQVTINIAAGTYNGFSINFSLISSWLFNGAGVGSTTIAASSSGINNGFSVLILGQGVNATLQSMTFTSFYGNVSVGVGECLINNCNMTGSANFASVTCSGGDVNFTGSCGYSGNGVGIFFINAPGRMTLGATTGATVVPCAFTVSGTPAITTTAEAIDGGFFFVGAGSSITGSSTGKRYAANLNGVFDTGGSGPNFFPGNVSGTATNGGQYN